MGWALERPAREPATARCLAESLHELESRFLTAFIREVLRWRPPVVDAVRQLIQLMEFADYRIPAGILTVVAPLLAPGNAESTSSSEALQPCRFLNTVEPVRNWIPFGGARRYCLGAELAVLQMEVILSQLIGAVTLSPARPRVETARLLGTVAVPSRGSLAVIHRKAPSRSRGPCA
ncbi:MAG: cytochrome P450 [Microbacteriaceae bacterium]|nr:MAG: cytochrome P450 [Microbacteriaceae bacterium]